MINKLKIAASAALLLIWTLPANALSLEEAGVEKGEVEVQYEATYTDDNGEGAYAHEEELEAQLGVTNWLMLTVAIGFEEEEGESSFDFSEIEAAATIELVDPEKDGFGLALYGRLSKEFAQEDDEKDENEFAIGVIAEQTFNDKWLVRGNLFYIGDMDNEEDEQFDGVEYAYQVRYQMTERFGIGVEGYGTHKDFDDEDEDDTTEHMVGPVFYFSHELERGHEKVSLKDDDDGNEEEGLELEAQFGVLFGTNDDTADVTFKWGLELDF
ncbi:MAG: hypothetical protein ACRBBJ_08825 [Rhodomicrobiaceae bacterium]